MKLSYKSIITTLATTLALVSCQKETVVEKTGTDSVIEDTRTIAVWFAASAKTYLDKDGVTPKFKDGDIVKVSNGLASEDCRITVDKSDEVSFSTKLTGPLTAVYPASAAKMNKEEITGILIPSNQTGRFADANICMATDISNNAIFKNQTAILKFYIDRSIGVVSLDILSGNSQFIADGKIGENGEITEFEMDDYGNPDVDLRSWIKVAPTYESEEGTLADITDDPKERICYVAVRPTKESETYDLRFIGSAKSQSHSGDIVAPTEMDYSNVSLPVNSISNAFIPYFIKVRVGGTDDNPEYQKWSYCNLGAFLPEETGYFFSWGNTEGHWKNGVSDGYAFSLAEYGNTPGSQITDDLPLENDAAFLAWGDELSETWRMPTKEECQKLLVSTNTTEENFVENKGLFINGTPLLFPFTGIFNESGSVLEYTTAVATIWTSSVFVNSSNPSAYASILSSIEMFDIQPYPRNAAMPIRPIYNSRPAIIPINQQFATGTWFITKNNLSPDVKPFFESAEQGSLSEGEKIVYMGLGDISRIRENTAENPIMWSLFFQSGNYYGRFIMETTLEGEDKVSLSLSSVSEPFSTYSGNATYYYDYSDYDKCVGVFNNKTFIITTDNVKHPSYLILTDADNPNYYIKLVPESATYLDMEQYQ